MALPVSNRYRRLLRYGRPYRRGWALIVLVTLVSTAFGLLGPWPMKVLVDNVLGDRPLGGLLSGLPGTDSTSGLLAVVVVAGLVIFAGNSTLDVGLTYLWTKVGRAMVYDLARDLFSHLQRQSLLFHSRHPVGDSMSRVGTDSWCVHTVVDELVMTPLHAVVTTAAIVVVMAGMNLTLTLVTFVVAPLMAWSSVMLGRPIRKASRAARLADSQMHSHVQQTLAGVHVIQAFTQEERQQREFRELARTIVRSKRQGALATGFNGLASGLINAGGNGLVLWLGARAVLGGSLTVGSLLVFAAYLRKLEQQFRAFTDIYSKLQGARGSIDRVNEILDNEPEVADRPGAIALATVEGRVRLDGVTFGYEPDHPVLRNVSLEASPGEVVAIVGATGAGKSTVVSLVPRFFDPQQGRVLVDGRDVRDVQLASLRSQVSLVLQESFLFPVSLADNIAYGRREASREEIEAAARSANAHAFIERLPDGYDTVVGERGATLSGGERQRVAIARALLKDAPILILDEPTSALDAETESLLLEALERLMAGRTTLIIAHRLSTIRRADRIVVLRDGEVVEEGTHAALLASGNLYARLHLLQSGETAASR